MQKPQLQVNQKLPVCWAKLPGRKDRSVCVPEGDEIVLEKIFIFNVKDSNDRKARCGLPAGTCPVSLRSSSSRINHEQLKPWLKWTPAGLL